MEINKFGALKLTSINDYIEPSQACVNMGSVNSKRNDLIVTKTDRKVLPNINLVDCLSCSGCVTSAEAVLVDRHNHRILMEKIKECSEQMINITISQHSLANICRFLGEIDLEVVRQKIIDFFRRQNANCSMIDLTVVGDCQQIARELVYEEFMERHQNDRDLPLLTGECPGLVCYCEKTQTQQVVDLISKIRSPMEIMGEFVNKRNSPKLVIAVMPCYDKKLEAAKFGDCDFVITTNELAELMEMPNKNPNVDNHAEQDYFNESGGGYLGYVKQKLLLSNIELLEQIEESSKDWLQIALVDSNTKSVRFRLLYAYGFKNLQRVLLRIKRGKRIKIDFVEVMACPGGCLLGGNGQCKVDQTGMTEFCREIDGLSSETAKDAIIEEIGDSSNFKTNYFSVDKSNGGRIDW